MILGPGMLILSRSPAPRRCPSPHTIDAQRSTTCVNTKPIERFSSPLDDDFVALHAKSVELSTDFTWEIPSQRFPRLNVPGHAI